jgi:hypothetical protein
MVMHEYPVAWTKLLTPVNFNNFSVGSWPKPPVLFHVPAHDIA